MRRCLILRQLYIYLSAITLVSLPARAADPVFSNPVRTPTNRISFNLTTDSRNYAIQVSTNLQDWTSIASTGFGPADSNRVHSLLQSANSSQLFYRTVVATSAPPFTFALAAISNITLNGNTVIDSFNSANTNFSSWVTNVNFGTNLIYDAAKHRDKGDIGATSALVDAVGIGNANIWGKLHTGPGSQPTTATMGPNGKVGDANWQAAGSSGFQAGSWLYDMNVTFPDVPPPASGGLYPGSGSYRGTIYPVLLGGSNGKYEVPSGSVNGKVCVTGSNVVLWAKGGLNFSGSAGIYIAPGASVTIYVGNTTGSAVSAKLSGLGGVNANGYAKNCQIYGLPTCTSVSIDATVNCTIYAPQANVVINSATTINGSIVANSITTIGDDAAFHYDESLANLPADF